MIPHRTPFVLPLLYPSLKWRMDSGAKELYLTFDDGPVPGPTDFALDHLSASSVLATFFCIGDNIRKHPEVFRRIVDAGHVVGNHTMHHLNGWKTPASDYVANAALCDRLAAEQGYSHSVTLFRPPYGRITRKQIRALAHYRIIMWDVLSQDYNSALSPDKCLRRTIDACRPGSIIVFHDSYKSQRNMEYALPRLIDHFASQGYRFRPITLNSRQSNIP